ncbi:MAG: phosphoglycerate dehydrogenase [Planctomycetota bacterium]|nr:phosphoglycerate dehydrogenase [Planctomycetota bacterium]MDA1252575.1 phosphoglycerate dehydrogenase [Planctomycetota bacterium]
MSIVMIEPQAFWKKPGPFVDLLLEAGHQIRYADDATFAHGRHAHDETVRQLSGCAATMAGGVHYTPEVMEQLPELKIIARAGVGYDRVDVSAATKLGKVLTITPFSNHESVAELAFALILSCAKRLAFNDRNMREGGWPNQLTKPIRKQTLGLIGLGRIGRSTAVRGVAMGMKVIARELYPDQEFVKQHSIELVTQDELLARSDYVSLHCPLSDETHGMCNAAFFAKMKPGSTLINTSRGGLVQESALLDALNSDHLRAAGLDVFEQEPTPVDNPLRSNDKVVMSPHIAGTDEMSMEGMGVECAENIIALLNGEWPEASIVNREVKELWDSNR